MVLVNKSLTLEHFTNLYSPTEWKGARLDWFARAWESPSKVFRTIQEPGKVRKIDYSSWEVVNFERYILEGIIPDIIIIFMKVVL